MQSILPRFLRYVAVDTQSQPGVEAVPSTEKQRNLSKILVDELTLLGLKDIVWDEHNYVYATLPANCSSTYTLGFVAHVDTSSAVSGKDVKPQVIANYDGGEVVLGHGYVLSPKDFPELPTHAGKTLITTSGDTLLGADDKAGVVEIVTMLEELIKSNHPHGTIKVAFTPDEEVGRGTAFFDVEGFACDGAYTVDGGALGELEYENFNAAGVKVAVNGKSVHPGSAKGKMVNAILVLMELQGMLPAFENPMYTEGYEGFYHLDNVQGNVDQAHGEYIIRDHDFAKFTQKKAFFQSCVDFLNNKYGAGTVECAITDSYFNMKEHVQKHFHLVENAKLAMEAAGVTPLVVPIRGGTDGATLSYMGLPCPNLFTGGYNFHGRFEYIPLEDMQKAVEVLLNIVDLYAKR